MSFDPERDGWTIPEAMMRTVPAILLRAVRHSIEELIQRGLSFRTPSWWRPELAPEPGERVRTLGSDRQAMRGHEAVVAAVETYFENDLYGGGLVCWARPGTPIAEHVRLPASVWAVMSVDHRTFGVLQDRNGRRYFAARVEPPGAVCAESPKKNKGGRPATAIPPIVAAKAGLWIEGYGEPDTLAEIEREIHDLLAEAGHTAAESTVRDFAKLLLELHRRNRAGQHLKL